MALKKSSTITVQPELNLSSLNDCLSIIQGDHDMSDKHMAVEKMSLYDGGIEEILKIFKDPSTNHNLIAYIGSFLSNLDPKVAPIESIMEILKSENAFLRNTAIQTLQSYGGAIKYYIVKYLIGDVRDLRIFAINVLGDVKFPESRDMLLELLEKETDVNVAMTAVDYLAEIGQPEDVNFLETHLLPRFLEEPYAQFAIKRAIKAILG